MDRNPTCDVYMVVEKWIIITQRRIFNSYFVEAKFASVYFDQLMQPNEEEFGLFYTAKIYMANTCWDYKYKDCSKRIGCLQFMRRFHTFEFGFAPSLSKTSMTISPFSEAAA